MKKSEAENLKKLTQKIIAFRDARDWKQFHNPKDLAITLALETAEVLEQFQWKSEEEVREYIKTNKEEIGEELFDVLHCLLIIAHDLDIDILEAAERKLAQNEKKYPVEKSKGRHTKYTHL